MFIVSWGLNQMEGPMFKLVVVSNIRKDARIPFPDILFDNL